VKKAESAPRLVAYARVSTDDQNLSLQLDAFKKVGVHDDNIHVEKKSGVSSKRPQLEYAMKDLREGDTFVIWKLDRLGRSPPMLYAALNRILGKGCGFRSLTENIDVGTAVGRLLFGILGAIAGFERDLIAERTAAGLAVLKERAGKDWKWGPKVFMTPKRIKLVGDYLNGRSGKPQLTGPKIAERMKISTASIYAFWKQDGPGKFIRKTPGDRGSKRSRRKKA
jgi:DNA invertase Pin-like site-specific DNA recombinase